MTIEGLKTTSDKSRNILKLAGGLRQAYPEFSPEGFGFTFRFGVLNSIGPENGAMSPHRETFEFIFRLAVAYFNIVHFLRK